MQAGHYIVMALMFATLAVLVGGVVMMGMGGNANRRYGNKMMIARVSLQGLALLMLAVLFLVGHHS